MVPMKRQALEHLRSAIEANTERKSLDELRAQGKRHVRVVSGDKVMQIIKAVVADIIDREVGEMSSRDRTRIENATKKEFDRVLKLQADQDAIVKQQKDLVGDYREKLKKLSVTVQQSEERIDELREGKVTQELELARLRAERDTLMQRSGEDRERLCGAENALRKAEIEVERLRAAQDLTSERAEGLDGRLDELKDRAMSRELECKRLETELEHLKDQQTSTTKRAKSSTKRVEELTARLMEREIECQRLESDLQNAKSRGADLDTRSDETKEQLMARDLECKRLQGEIETLGRRHDEDAGRVEEAQQALVKRDLEIERVRGERDTLAAEVQQLREAGKADTADSFKSELSDMRAFLDAMEQRAAHKEEETMNTLINKLESQASVDSRGMEERFAGQLDDALDKISKTMEAATATPIDIVVEATDVLVDKLFDMEDAKSLSTNLDTIDVEETKTKTGIGRNLDALKRMRAGQAKKKPEAAKDARPPEGEAAEVSDEQKARVNSSVDRLKAVRDGSASEGK